MDPFDLAQSFIEQGATIPSTEGLAREFQRTLEHLGFRYFACCSHVDPRRPPGGEIMLLNYPTSWVDSYSQCGLHQIDPVMLKAERTFLPFSWEAPDFRARLSAPQRRMLADARAVGLAQGYTIPMQRLCGSSARGASCSVVADSRIISANRYFAVQLISLHLYELLARRAPRRGFAPAPERLSARERQCLELASQGKSNWVIGEILCISEHTVHRHVESAKRRLGVATRAQAIIRAAEAGQISIGDVIRASSSSTPTQDR